MRIIILSGIKMLINYQILLTLNNPNVLVSDFNFTKQYPINNSVQVSLVSIDTKMPTDNYTVFLIGKMNDGEFFKQKIADQTWNSQKQTKWTNILLPDGENLTNYTMFLVNPSSLIPKRLGLRVDWNCVYKIAIKDRYETISLNYNHINRVIKNEVYLLRIIMSMLMHVFV